MNGLHLLFTTITAFSIGVVSLNLKLAKNDYVVHCCLPMYINVDSLQYVCVLEGGLLPLLGHRMSK